jgi:adenine deaminase
VNDNYRAVIEHLPITREDLYRLSRNAFEGAWISEAEKAGHLQRLDGVFAME